ncbi:MAG TPA: hypothetical protein P5092_11245 [Ruminococcus sp.]|nr:hypothetical protein [Ruminococcus flavefaciens]HRU97989.1 hypothetical protein [Ruminococcus sp.]
MIVLLDILIACLFLGGSVFCFQHAYQLSQKKKNENNEKDDDDRN